MVLTFPELFTKINTAATEEEAIGILRQNTSVPLLDVLKINFHPDVKMSLPAGEPPFKKNKDLPIGYAETNIMQEARRFYVWISSSMSVVPRARKEALFIQMLEGLHWTEAELICQMKDRQLETVYPKLTYFLVQKAFPDLLPFKEPPKEVPVEKTNFLEELPNEPPSQEEVVKKPSKKRISSQEQNPSQGESLE